ncbi:hypothetical protein [Pantoea agglomerans]|uniref:hypothetical protein n=1 Tax=Enterobacter agglomerans TaxID=549 RepID=UPI003D223F3B
MDFLKIKNTDSLLRDYYQLDEAAKILGCDVKELLWFARHKNIEICMEFYDDDLDVSSGLRADIDNEDLIKKLESLERDDNGYYILSEHSALRIKNDNDNFDDYGFLKCHLKGYFALNTEYKDVLIKHEGKSDEWPDYFIISGSTKLDFPVKFYVNYDERENYFLMDTLWITKNQIGNFLNTVIENKKPKNTEKNYKSQSDAQKQKHAVPRTEILMAVISLFHRDMKLRRESPAAIAEHLFSHATDFWPEKGEPPLRYETVVSLLRSCLKKDGLTFK